MGLNVQLGIYPKPNLYWKGEPISPHEYRRVKPYPHIPSYAFSENDYVSVWEGNISHDCVEIARKCGVYDYIWRPEEFEIKKADKLIVPLWLTLNNLEKDVSYFSEFGGSIYSRFRDFVMLYLDACMIWQEATVHVYR